MSKNTGTSKEYEISSAIVTKMWGVVSHAQGILLTQIEAILGDSSQATAFKSLVKREFNTMGGYIQNIVYEEWKVQERGVGKTSESPPMIALYEE